jgi:hypothetical protein
MRAVELFEVLASTTWHTIFRTNYNRISFAPPTIDDAFQRVWTMSKIHPRQRKSL